MFIDCHSHLIPKDFALGPRPKAMFDVEALLAQQEEAGVVSVFSNTGFTYHPDKLDPSTIDNIRRHNCFAAELSAKYPGRLIGMVAANPFGGNEHLKETERALKEGLLKGIMVNSSIHGEYLDSPRAYPFYELVCELDAPVFIHPPAIPIGSEKMGEYRLMEMVGRPVDTTLTLARAIYAGVLERFPKLKLVAAHVGGAITMLAGRLDYGYAARHDSAFLPLGPWGDDILTKPPSEYIKQLYVDTMSFHVPAIMCAIETLGADHVVFGTDFPPVEVPLKVSTRVVESLPISDADKEKIARGNAQRLLGLTTALG